MDIYLKIVSGILIGCILSLILSSRSKDFSLLVSIGICAISCISSVQLMDGVIDFLKSAQSICDLDNQMLSIVLKCTGIGLITEIAGTICQDSGNGALAKVLQICGAAAALWLSLPLLQKLLDILLDVLNNL